MELPPRVRFQTENPLHGESMVENPSVSESGSWTANRNSVDNLFRRRSRESTIIERINEYESRKSNVHAVVDDDFLSIPHLDFDEEYTGSVQPLLRMIDWFHLFFFGNGKWWIIPLLQWTFLAANTISSLISYYAEATEDNLQLLKYSGALGVLTVILSGINYISMYLLLKSGHVKRMLLSNCCSKGEQRQFLIILICLITSSLFLSLCSTLFYATNQNEFYETVPSLINKDNNVHSYARFNFIYNWGFLILSMHLYTSAIYCWVCYMMMKTFESHVLHRITYKNMPDVSDMIFSFYNRTQVISSFYYYSHLLRTIVTIPLVVVYFQTLYYLQDYKESFKSEKSLLIEYAPDGKKLYYRVMLFLNKDILGNFAGLLLTLAATWSIYIVTGILNDYFRIRLVKRLCFILLHTDLENEYSEEAIDDTASIIQKRERLTSIQVEDKHKDGEHESKSEVNSIEKYGDHRETIKDLVAMLNNTNLGLHIAGLLISTESAISIGTLLVALIGVVVKMNES